MSFLLVCALLGYFLGGIRGFLIGAAIGFVLSRVAQARLTQTLTSLEAQFLDSTFSVMGALCKADGVVSRDEIQVTEEIFVRLALSPEQKQSAKTAFNRGKAAEFDLDAEVERFVQSARGGSGMFQLFLQVQLTAIAADGQVHPAEHAMLVRIARRLGLGEGEVARLEAVLRAAAGGAASPGGPAPKQRLDDAYAALGVTPDSSEAEIKRAYRKLMSENHPDKLRAKGLPEGMRQLAEQRAREINAAYDLVRTARQFR